MKIYMVRERDDEYRSDSDITIFTNGSKAEEFLKYKNDVEGDYELVSEETSINDNMEIPSIHYYFSACVSLDIDHDTKSYNIVHNPTLHVKYYRKNSKLTDFSDRNQESYNSCMEMLKCIDYPYIMKATGKTILSIKGENNDGVTKIISYYLTQIKKYLLEKGFRETKNGSD